jgi:hypothetical protein
MLSFVFATETKSSSEKWKLNVAHIYTETCGADGLNCNDKIHTYGKILIIIIISTNKERLCGLVVRVLGFRSGDPGSIPGTTRKESSGSGTGSTQPRECN